MNIRHIYILSAALLLSAAASAQRRLSRAVKPDTTVVLRAYTDSLSVSLQRVDSLAAVLADSRKGSVDGRYFRLFVPPTFYHSAAVKTLEISPAASGRDKVTDAVDAALLSMYLRRPDLVAATETGLRKVGSIRADVEKPVRRDVELTELVEPVSDEPVAVPVEIMVRRPNFWTFSGDNSLQVMQNYVSENWHKGGESNYSMVGSVVLNANYNNKKRLKLENKLEMKLGYQTSPSDTLHKYKTNNDLLRYTGKLGLLAAKRWYYTLQVLAYTQFAKGLKSNDKKVYSDFMSPFNLNIGLGMDYSVETRNKRLTGSVNLSFLSFNFRYVDRKNLAKKYGVIGDHHTLEDFGSQLTTSLTWNITDQIKWVTRLYGYTTYEKALIEWENTITLNVTKYLSTRIFVYPRFDDSAKKPDEEWGYWQLNEYCSLGLSYSF